jgi:hypothetical protein
MDDLKNVEVVLQAYNDNVQPVPLTDLLQFLEDLINLAENMEL